jgi:phosphate transport system substrate-binding protein
MDDPAKTKKLKDFLSWALHDGERMAPTLGYASLPATLVGRLDSLVASVSAGSP